MSQQTPVARLTPTWQRWLDMWPAPANLAVAARSDVIREWGTLGYPRRALWLRDAAEVMVRDFEGEVPTQYADLVALPGVGDYTASAVLAFAFEQRIAVLDTNVRRVLARVFDGIEGAASAAPTRAERELADHLLPREDPARWSVAVMEFGALLCRAKSPECASCPIKGDCAWRGNGYPSAGGPAKRRQQFAGTDRQVRGKILSVLRHNPEPVTRTEINKCWPDATQLMRCLDSLIADGLVEPLRTRYRLPE